MSKPTIPPAIAHLYAFPTTPVRISIHEIQTLVANLIIHDVWFEFQPNEEQYVIRVQSENYPLLADIRERIPT